MTQRVVIAGAGPAGLLTAIYMARRGFQVDIYEKREKPRHGGEDMSDHERAERAYFVLAHARAAKALAEAGIDLALLTSSPGNGILQYSALQLGGARRLRGRQIPVKYTLLGGEQQDFVRALAAAAEQLGGGRISIHWGAAVEAVDLAGRRVQVAGQEGGQSEEVEYDLLVGADGWASKVRQAAEQQVPGFHSRVEHNPIRRKVFTIRAHEALPMRTVAGGHMQWSFMSRSHGASSPTQGTLFLFPRAGTDSVRGLLAMKSEGWRGLESAADYEGLLRREFPALPADCVQEIAAQLPHHQEYPTGTRVSCSSLHGPSMVLVGDAGHGISPRAGNGMTAALEDAWLLDQVLQEAGGNLAALPERWSAARLPDARALYWIDTQWMRRFGRGAWGRLDPVCISNLTGLVARLLLSKALGPRWVAPPAVFAMNEGQIPYREVKARLQRDDALLASLAMGVVAAAAARRLG